MVRNTRTVIASDDIQKDQTVIVNPMTNAAWPAGPAGTRKGGNGMILAKALGVLISILCIVWLLLGLVSLLHN